MTPAGTSNELDVQNGWEENTHTLRGSKQNDTTSGESVETPCSGFLFIAFVMYIATTMCDGVLHCLCMVINISVQYNGGLLPDIILLTQGYYQWGTRLNTM